MRHALAVKRVGRSKRVSSPSKYSVAEARSWKLNIHGELLLLTEYVRLERLPA